MTGKTRWGYRVTILAVVLGGVLAGCAANQARECVTKTTEACIAGLANVDSISMYYDSMARVSPLLCCMVQRILSRQCAMRLFHYPSSTV